MKEVTSMDSLGYQIERTKRDIIKKYNQLKRQLQENDELLKKKYKPLTDEIKGLACELKKSHTLYTENKINEKGISCFGESMKNSKIFPDFVFSSCSNNMKPDLKITPTPIAQEVQNLDVDKEEQTSEYDEEDEEENTELTTDWNLSTRVPRPQSSVEKKLLYSQTDNALAKYEEEEEGEEDTKEVINEEQGAGQIDTQCERERLIMQAGALSSKYVEGVSNKITAKYYDTIYGIKFDGNTLCMGDSIVRIVNDSIWIGEDTCKIEGTKGLLELLFQKIPDINTVTKKDMSVYKDILKATNSHKLSYSPDGRINRKPKNIKYNSVISKLFPTKNK